VTQLYRAREVFDLAAPFVESFPCIAHEGDPSPRSRLCSI
jgi:hypothetical protein